MSGGTGYVIAAYGVFGGMLGAYVGILLPRRARRKRAIAALEEEAAGR